ncbi:hypothetical protein [Tabrizicola sp.]|uniref:hypothetical protein n=1 Tax=Tabrizicola sp. TaxID=2005166 RepID=UPI0035AF7EB9
MILDGVAAIPLGARPAVVGAVGQGQDTRFAALVDAVPPPGVAEVEGSEAAAPDVDPETSGPEGEEDTALLAPLLGDPLVLPAAVPPAPLPPALPSDGGPALAGQGAIVAPEAVTGIPKSAAPLTLAAHPPELSGVDGPFAQASEAPQVAPRDPMVAEADDRSEAVSLQPPSLPNRMETPEPDVPSDGSQALPIPPPATGLPVSPDAAGDAAPAPPPATETPAPAAAAAAVPESPALKADPRELELPRRPERSPVRNATADPLGPEIQKTEGFQRLLTRSGQRSLSADLAGHQPHGLRAGPETGPSERPVTSDAPLPPGPDPQPPENLSPLPQPAAVPRAALPAIVTATAAPPVSPLVQAVLDRVLPLPSADRETVVRLNPSGLGLIEVAVQDRGDGAMDIALRVQNAVVLDALRHERDAVAQAVSAAQGGASGSLSMDLFHPGPDHRGPGPQAPGSTGREADTDPDPAEAQVAAPAVVLRADRVNILT